MDETSGLDLNRVDEVAQAEDEGQVVHLKDASDEPLFHNGRPVTVRIAGKYSAIYRRTQDRLTARSLKHKGRVEPDDLSKHLIELVAVSIMPQDWYGFTKDGVDVPYSKDMAKKLAETPFIRTQLQEAQNDHAGFTKSSSPS